MFNITREYTRGQLSIKIVRLYAFFPVPVRGSFLNIPSRVINLLLGKLAQDLTCDQAFFLKREGKK